MIKYRPQRMTEISYDEGEEISIVELYGKLIEWGWDAEQARKFATWYTKGELPGIQVVPGTWAAKKEEVRRLLAGEGEVTTEGAGEGFLSNDGIALYKLLIGFGWTPLKAYSFAYDYDMGETPIEVVEDTLTQLESEWNEAESKRFTEAQKGRAETPREISPEVKAFGETQFAEVLPSLRDEIIGQTQDLVEAKILETKQTTGRDTSPEGVLSVLTPEEIGGLEEGGIKAWLNTPGGQNAIPLQNAWGQLSKAAHLTGMNPAEYLFSSYSDYISGFHPDYIAERGETQLLQDFMGFKAPGGRSIVDYIGGDISIASGAVGAEVETTRGKLTPKYERTAEGGRQLATEQPLPQATPPATYKGRDVTGYSWETGQYVTTDPTTGGRVAAPALETPAITETVKAHVAKGTKEGGTEAYGAGGGQAPYTVTQAQARASYNRELKRRGYGAGDVAYLSQFFNQLLPGPYPQKWEVGRDLEGLDIPSPPQRAAKKTRFLGGIR